MGKALRIVFLGTPDFAAAGLGALVKANLNVVAVVTAPDKPKGRGRSLGISAVKALALSYEIPVLQPSYMKSSGFVEELKSYRADLQIVVAFRMLPEAVWNMPPLGTFNLHASLLPQYRGAAPIHWAIINGEQETGVTTFFLKHEIDTGAIIFQEKEPIHEEDTVGDLYGRLMKKGAELVVKTAWAVQDGDYRQIPQSVEGPLKPAPKIFKKGCKIDWDRSSRSVINFIRGLSPRPAAWVILDGKVLRIFKAVKSEKGLKRKAGTFDSDGKKYLSVGTSDGNLDIVELQIEGKRRMNVEEFLRGYPIRQVLLKNR